MIITSISNSNFIHYAKTLHPFHPNYRQYWLQEYSRIIEGYWNSGVFMPPKLYFYVNHGTIQKKKGNLRIDDHPDLRDVEWDFHYTLMEAKGFSGFSDDPFFSSHKSLIDDTLTEHPSIYREEEIEEEIEEWNEDLNLYITNTVKKTVQVKKQYVDPRTYLRSIHKYHLGKPLYFNECENLIFMAGRGLGKDLEENTLVYKVDINSIDASNSLNGFKYTAVKIKDIEIGDFILSYNLTTIVKVINKESYSNQVMYKISLKNDNIIECGGGHLWYTRSLSRIKLSNTEELYNHYHYYKNSYNISLPIFNAYNTDVLPDSIKKTIINSIFNKTIFTRNKFNTFSITEKTSEPNTINFLVSLFNKWGIKYRYSNLTNRLWCNLNRVIDINKEKDKWVLIKDIEKTIIKNSVCIEVEDLYNTTIETRTKSIPNKLFAIGKNDGEFIITHNSFLTEHVVLHEWLTDGVTDTSNPDNKRAKVEIVVGASDAKYSIDHLSKLKNSLEKLRGGYKIGDRLFPAPLNKRYTGGWNVSNKIIAQTKIRKNGIDRIKGTKSFIKHVSWNGNPFAAQGGRNNLIVYEEIGMANELLDVYGAIKDTMIVEGFKMGVAMFIGTGGAFSSGGTLGAYKMFYNPKAYQCLAFGDEWENKGSIGYFIPAYYSYNDLRDDNGNIIMDKAVARLEKKRKENTDSLQLANDMQNNPQVPSEIFLVQTGNLFPSAEIKARINAVEANQDILQKKVELYFDKACVKTNGVNYTLDTTNKLMAINDYPWKDSESQITREGSVVIYEFPIVEEGRVPEDLYIIGHDPFKNNTDGGESFAGIYVLKTTSRLELGTNEVVAEYIGRPFMGEDAVNDILLKLSMFYGNAKIFFENNVGNTKEYFEKHRMLHLLATKPGSVLTNSISKGPNVIYGYNISNREIKMRALGYVRQWLLDKDEVGNRNLDKIQSRILLKQLLQFNLEGNFDAVMAFAGCIIGLNERYNKFEERVKELTVDSNDLEFLNTFLSYRDTNSIYLRNRIL